jgi:hypothetical protein
MKNRVLPLFILLASVFNIAEAKNYYVSSTGNNANNGLTPTTAWQSITKVNSYFASMLAGDSILFRRGDTFYGAIVVNKSGTSSLPIVISAFGSGAKPIITGFKTLTTWTSLGNGIYQSAVPAAKTTLNMVTLDNVAVALGRYPNADAANGGYLNYESFSGYTSITDNQLTSTTNWTGAEVVIRKRLWVLDRCKVTAHSGGTLTYTNTNGSVYTGSNNYGYFIQNDARTLDQLGEWYLNKTTKYLQMYFGTASPSSYTVKASTLDTLVTLSTKTYININNISFEGANENAFYSTNSSYINIQNCDFRNAGASAILTQTTANLLIENCTTNYVLNNGIVLNNSKSSNNTIRSCTVKNSGKLPGMGLSNGGSYKGISASALSNLLIEYNNVDTCGYVAIQFQGSNVTVKNNVVNYFDFVVDDAGGIYSYCSGTDAAPGTIYTNRVVRDNIVMNGAGAPNGRSSSSLFVSGIYMDGRTMNVSILNNTVFNNGKNGIHCNNPNNVTINGNTSFNNLNAMSIMRWSWGNITGLSIKNNIFYPKTEAQRSFYYSNSGLNEPVASTVNQTLQNLGNIDTNYYSMINPVGFNFEIYGTTGGSLIQTSAASLNGWKSVSNHDIKSKLPARLPVSYQLSNLVGINLFKNSAFLSGVTGITTYGTSVLGTWDNTAKISGGALKIAFSAPAANKYSISHGPVGAVSSSKKYVLRFSTYGTTEKGIVRAYIRKTTSPYNNLAELQTESFGIGKKDHEFLFVAPTTDAGGSLVIEVEQNSGTTYIDNIVFNEATATLKNTDDQLRFEYNATRTAKTVALDATYVGVDGTPYTSSVTLQPYTSLILLKDTGATALKVTAIAPSIKCFGGTTTVTVSASGGTAPYTGTGIFTKTVGTFAFTVTDAKGAAVTTNITVTQPAVALAASATAGTITQVGGSTTASVTATGGTAPYTGIGSFTVTAGTYNYTVIDASGCTTTASIVVAAPGGGNEFVATAPASVAIGCFGSASTATVTATGGTAPYTGTGVYPVSAGKGSIKLSFPLSVADTYSVLYYSIGSVDSTKRYVLRFSTVGTTNNGKLRTALRQTASPWTTFTPKQLATYGTARKDHEFFFNAPPSQAASYKIEVDQASGTTYIDNIAFFEVDATGKLIGNNLYANGQFEKNIINVFYFSNNNNETATWDSTGKITNTSYFTVSDANNKSSVAVVNTTQPVAPLKVSVTAGVLSVLGGSVTATVTATGGTAPYTGLGSFSILAGTYTYTVTDAKGCSASKTITVSLVLARGTSASAETTTITEVASKLSVTAYPNPSSSSFGLMVQGGINEKVTIGVYSFDGKVVYQTTGNTNTKYTFGNSFMAGVYIVKVVQNGAVQSLKLVKVN